MLQRMINKANEACKKYRMKLNAKETKVIGVGKNKWTEYLNITVENNKLKEIKEYIYLGSLITQDGRSTKEV